MHRFKAFGLNVDSDIHFPELLPLEDEHAKIDLTIRRSPVPFDAEVKLDKNQFFLNIPIVGEFLIQEGARILYYQKDNSTVDDLRLFILGSCLGCVLQQRGYVVLHGNAFSTDGETCQVVVGKRGAGKSTRAAWQYLKGHKILADDVCAISFTEDGKAWVIPGFPQIKLWQASADLLGISTNGLRRIRSEQDKFSLPMGNSFHSAPALLTDIVEIDQQRSSSVTIEGVKKISYLLVHSYRYGFLKKMGMSEDYRKKIMQLAGRVRMQSSPRIDLNQTVKA